MLANPGIIVAPGVTTALFARLIEDTGFSAQFVTGAGLANIHFGLPDYNLVTMTENQAFFKYFLSTAPVTAPVFCVEITALLPFSSRK